MALRRGGCLGPSARLCRAEFWRRGSSVNGLGASRVWPSISEHQTRAVPGPEATGSVPDFGDTREAYRSKSLSEMLRHYVVFKAFTFKPLVDNNKLVS